MKKYFNILLEFDPQHIDEVIQNAIKNREKGYVCSVESNNLTYANNHPEFLNVINNALINICDGSNIAWLLGKIYNKPYKSYIGADLFAKYVRMCCFKQYFLGNTRQVLDSLRDNLSQIDPAISEMQFVELPFAAVEQFNYKEIAHKINEVKPDIIWVSLGAPKQEFFMNRLLPYLDQGIMFGFGAIFNFNAGTGHVRRAPKWMLNLRLEWLYRALEEPRKNIPRYWNFIKILPGLINLEYKNIKR